MIPLHLPSCAEVVRLENTGRCGPLPTVVVAYGGAESETDWDIFVLASTAAGKQVDLSPAIDSSPILPTLSRFFQRSNWCFTTMWSVAVSGGKASGPALWSKPISGQGAFSRGMTRTAVLFLHWQRANEYIHRQLVLI
jgi:hypothetical protein